MVEDEQLFLLTTGYQVFKKRQGKFSPYKYWVGV